MLLSQNLQKKWTGKYFWKTRETTEAFQEAIELQREIKSCGFEEENYKAVAASLDEAERLRLRSELTQAAPILLSTAIMRAEHRRHHGGLRCAAAGRYHRAYLHHGFLLASMGW
jgi:hypothetical protein